MTLLPIPKVVILSGMFCSWLHDLARRRDHATQDKTFLMSLYVLHSPSVDGRSSEANGVRVGAGDAFVQLVTVHLGNEPHVHGRDENVEAVSVE